MAIAEFDASWRQWIQVNQSRGCDTAEMHRILLGHNFCPNLVSRTLNYWPVNPAPVKPPIHSTKDLAEEIAAASAVPKGAQHVDTDNRLQLYTMESFLSSGECQRIIDLVRPHLRPSTTTNVADQYRGFRTSRTCDLGLMESSLAQVIDRRICNTLGLNPSYSESIQAQWYTQGQQFKPHTDYFEPGSEEYRRFAGERGQRTWTFMIYLNGDCEGGETRFTRLEKTFSPQAGRAVIWNSLRKDGYPNEESIHWGMPVTRGEKVIITKWFRARGRGAQFSG